MLCSGTVLMVLTALMGMADTLIAGIMLGEEAVAGICLVLPIYSLASFFAACLSYGVPILYGRNIGAFRKDEADRCFGVGLTVVSVIGLLIFLAVLGGGEAYLRLLQPAGPAYDNARAYLSWMKYALLLLPLNELLDGMLFADGDETVSLTAKLAQGLLKLVLSAALCRDMGVKGLALASFASFAASVLISCLHFLRPGSTLTPNLAFSPAVFRDILKYGVVDASMYLFNSFFTFAVTCFVIARFGPEALVLVSVMTLFRDGQIIFEGIGEAVTPLISIYLGEENAPGVRKVWRLATGCLWAESLLATVLISVNAPAVVGLLGIRDPAISACAVMGLRILPLTSVFICRLFLDSSHFILVGRIPLGVFDSFLRDLFPALPLVVLGGLAGGVYGMFVGLAVAPALGYLLSVRHIRRRYGKENYPLFLSDMERGRHTALYEFRVLPGDIVRVRDEIGEALAAQACPRRQVNRVMLAFEELFMLIRDSNPGKTVLAECTVDIGDTVRLTTKDNGRIVDLTDTDRDVSSLRSYTLATLLQAHTVRRVHTLALSYNRTVLVIR